MFQAFIYLCASVIAVPLAKRLGLGSVLGYLIAGVLIGPVIGLVGTETQEIQHFAEFGVVMMLFLVGLELEPRALWEMRGRLLGLGGLQVLLTTAAVTMAVMASGQPWSIALAVGLVMSLSSTAIVLQTLNEKGQMKSDGGQASFSVLLFQDIAVIAMLALIPLLAVPELSEALHHSADDGHGGRSVLGGLMGWQVAVVNLLAIAVVVVGGHYLSRPLFRFIAGSKLREMFTAVALLLIIGIALLMTLVGLSPALGTFLAGVVLANSEYRHELESSIEPFKGLLLGLFFITVGAGIDFGLLFGDFVQILGYTFGLIVVKASILFILAVLFKVRGSDRWLFSLGLAQAGEFGFVLLSFSVQNAVVPAALGDQLLLVVALSMLLTPALFVFFDKVILARLDQGQSRDADEIAEKGKIVIAGLGRFGQIVNRILLASGYKTVVLEHRADTIDGLRKFGVASYFGDATRPDLLHSAGLEEASLLVVAIDEREPALELVQYAKRVNPGIHVVARVFDRNHVYQMYQAGADDIVREVFDSSVRAARYALEALGEHPFEAQKSTTVFVKRDREGLRELAALWDPEVPSIENRPYIEKSKEVAKRLEDALLGMSESKHDEFGRGWVTPGRAADSTSSDQPVATTADNSERQGG
ncbi:potassium transporter [Chromatiales bacterium (ex Bugula neritina AB1)]|nr:potassium transporter [Chromatiales bacterium (ex Bugula neritina AB1)]